MCTRIVIAAVAATALAAGWGTALRAQSPDAKAAEVIAAARKALGGEQKVASLQGLSLRVEQVEAAIHDRPSRVGQAFCQRGRVDQRARAHRRIVAGLTERMVIPRRDS